MKNWTIRRRIAMGFAAVLAILVVIVVITTVNTHSLITLMDSSRQASDESNFLLSLVGDHLRWARQLDEHLLVGAEFKGALDPTQCRLGKWLREESGTGTAEAAEGLRGPHEALHRSARDILAATGQGDVEAAKQIFHQTTEPALSKTASILEDLSARAQQAGAATSEKASLDAGRARTFILLAGAGALATGIGLVILITGNVARRLGAMSSKLGASAEQIDKASAQVATTSELLAQGASEQAAIVEETSAGMTEVGSLAETNAEHADKATEAIETSTQLIGRSNEQLNSLAQAMEAIKVSSGKIGAIIKVIDEIAFQTNILALNAAVEAARAGEAGMGFAVVADEVRNLAQRSAQAARDTSVLIEEAVRNSGEGYGKLQDVVESVSSVTKASETANRMVNEMRVASQQQRGGVDQIAQGVQQMEAAIQQTASSAEESAAAAEELHSQVAMTRELVGELRVLVEGARGRSVYQGELV